MNQIFLTGRLGQTPEKKVFDGGDIVVKFSLATSKKWKTASGEEKERTDWHTVKAWGRLGERCEAFPKGTLVTVAGELNYDEYEDGKGSKQKRAYIKAASAYQILLPGSPADGHPEQPGAPQRQPSTEQPAQSPGGGDDLFAGMDDLPF